MIDHAGRCSICGLVVPVGREVLHTDAHQAKPHIAGDTTQCVDCGVTMYNGGTATGKCHACHRKAFPALYRANLP